MNAAGGVGVGTAVNTATSGIMTLTTNGAAAAGNITVTEANALATSRVTLTTAGTVQTVTINDTAAGNAITTDGAIGAANDNIALNATIGKILQGVGTVTGVNVVLDSATGVGTDAANRVLTAATTLAARSRTSGGVYVSELNGVALNDIGAVGNTSAGNATYDVTAGGALDVVGAVNTVAGAVNLTSTSTIGESTGTIAGGTLTTSSVGGTTLNNANTVTGFNATNSGTTTGISLTNAAATLTITGISQTATGAVTVTNTGNIATSGAIGSAGNVNIYATGGANDDVTISSAINLTGAATASALDIRANRSIIFNASADVTATNANAITLNSDRDATNGGAISLGSGTVITSNGGDITLGGGATPASVAAIGTVANVSGVSLNNAQLLSGVGNISIRGTGSSLAGDSHHGVSITASSVVQSSTGLVTITGTGGAGNGASKMGVSIVGAGTSVTSNAGNISITGTGAGTGSSNKGVEIASSASVASTGVATVTITGTSSNDNGNQGMVGVSIDNSATVSTVTGDVTITGTGLSSNLNSFGVQLHTTGSVTSSGAGDIFITGTGGGGNEGILTSSAGNVIGSVTMTGDILLRSLGGTGMSFDASILNNVAIGSDVTLNAVGGGAITQTGGSIVANGLRVLGDTSATASLNSATNNVVTLAGNMTGANATLSYTDTNGFAIGSLTTSPDGGVTTTTDGLTVGAAATSTNTITLTAGGAVTQAAALPGAVVAGGLRLLGAGSYDLTTSVNNDITTLAGNVTGNVKYKDSNGFAIGTVTTLGLTSGANITLDTVSASAVTQSQAITASGLELLGAGSYDLQNTGNNIVTLAANLTTATTGTLTYTDSNDLTVGIVNTTGVTTNGGVITLKTLADNALLTITNAVNSTGAAINYTSDRMTLTGTTTATAAIATLKQTTAGRQITLGTDDVSATSATTGTLGLTSAELDTVTAGTIRIGDTAAGNLSVTGAIAPAGTAILSLISNGTVTQSATITETNLRVSAAGAVTLNQANDVTTLAVSNAGNSVAFTDANGFTVGTVDAIDGITGSTVALTATNGTLIVSNTAAASDINATGAITLDAAAADTTVQIATTADVKTTTGGVTITADLIDLLGTVTAAAQTVTLQTTSAAQAIEIGGVAVNADSAAKMTVTSTEADQVLAGTLTIGRAAQTAGVTVVGNMAPATATTLNVTTGGAIVDATAGVPNAGVLTENVINLTATNGIGVSHAGVYNPIAVQTATSAGLNANNGAAGTGTGDVSLVQPTGVLTVNGGGATITNTANNGAIDLTTSAGNINVFGTVSTAGNGAVYMDAQTAGSNIVMDSVAASLIQSGAAGVGTGLIDLKAATDIQLGQVKNAGIVNLTATAGSITDINGATNNVTATTLNATAAANIGNVAAGTVLVGPTNAIETAVSVLSVTTTAGTGSQIAVDNTLVGTLTPGVTLFSANGNNIWIRNSGSLNVATTGAGGAGQPLVAGVLNNVGYIATTGTLTIPTTSATALNVLTGSVNLQGGTDVLGLGGHAVADVTAANFLLSTGAAAASVAFRTSVDNLDAVVTGAGKTLTVIQDATVGRNLALTDLNADGKSIQTNAAAISISNYGQNNNLTANNTVDALGGNVSLIVNNNGVASAAGTGSVLVASGANVTTNSLDAAPDTGVLSIAGRVTVTGNVHATTTGVTTHTVALTAPSASITITPTGITGSGTLTLNPGAGNNVTVQAGGQVVVTAGGGGAGNLYITNATNVNMQGTTSSIVVDGSVNIGINSVGVAAPISGNVILNNITTANAGGTGGMNIGNVGGAVQFNGIVNTNGNNVTLTNIAGSITTAGSGSLQGVGTLTLGTPGAGSLAAGAVSNIGSNLADLSVSANNITVQSLGAGAYINNAPTSGVVSLSGNMTALNAPLTYRQTGQTLSVGSVTTNGGAFTIDPPVDTIVNGNIFLGAGAYTVITNGAYVQNQSVAATRTYNADLTVTAGTAGTAGNAVTITIVDAVGATVVTGAGTDAITVTADLTTVTNAGLATALNGIATATAGNLVATGGITLGLAQAATSLINGAAAASSMVTAGTVNITANTTGLNSAGHQDIIFNQTAGAVTGINATGNVVLSGASVLFNDLAANTAGTVVNTTGTATVTATTGTITRTATAIALNDIAGTQLALNAINGSIGGAAANTSVVVNASSKVSADTSTANGAIYLASPAAMPLGLVNAGTGTVTLTAGTAISNANGGSTNINAGVLTMSAAGAIGAVGTAINTNVTSVTALTSAAGDIVLNETNAITLTDVRANAATNGAVSVTAGGSILATKVYSAGILGNNVSLIANGGASTLTANDVQAGTNSDVTLNGGGGVIINGVSNLVNLDVTGATTINAGTMTTSGTQAYHSAVTLGSTVAMSATTATFDNTVNALVANTQGLDITGNAVFSNNVGTGAALNHLTVSGTTGVAGNITTNTGVQTYAGLVTLNNNATLTATGSTLSLNGGVLGTSALTDHSLTISATTVNLGDGLGADSLTGLTTLAVTGATTINASNVTSSGTQAYTGAVRIGKNNVPVTGPTLTGSTVTFNGTVDSVADVANTLVITGNAAFNGLVGANATGVTTLGQLGSLSVSGTTALATTANAVNTTGGQTYTGVVTLADAAATTYTLTSSATGAVNFVSTVDGATTGGNATLAVNTAGATTFGGAVGATKTLAALSTDATGTTAINGGVVTTTGLQTYLDAVTLGANTALSGTTITLGSTTNAAGAGLQGLAITGNAVIGGVVGGTALSYLTVSGTTALNAAGNAITTTGLQTYTGAVTLADAAATTYTLTSSAAGAVNFVSTVDGATTGGNAALVVNTDGVTTFGSNVGTTLNLASVFTDANAGVNAAEATVIKGNVTTTGIQTYNDAVQLGAATVTLSSSGVAAAGNITLAKTVDSDAVGTPRALVVNTAGTTTFGGAVGNLAALLSVTTNVGGTTAINGGSVVTIGGQTYNDDITLAAVPTTLWAVNGTTGIIAINGNVTGAGSTLTLSGGTSVAIGSVAGNSLTGVSTLDVTGATTINAGTMTTSGTQAYHSAVTLGSTVAMSATTATFDNTVNALVANTQGLDITGNAVFSNNVGTLAALNHLTVSGTTGVAGSVVTNTGAQSYAGLVTLNNNATLTATGGVLSLKGGVLGTSGLTDHSLTISATTVNLGDALGADSLTGLTTLAVTGATTINASNVTSSGTQAYTGAVLIGKNDVVGNTGPILTGSTVTFNGTVDSVATQANTLVITGNAAMNGLVGAAVTGQLGSLSVSGTTALAVTANAVNTTGGQTYTGAVTLADAAATTYTLTSSAAGAVNFVSTVDGATTGGNAALVVNTAGVTTFGGAVGNTLALASVLTDAPGSTTISGGSVTTSAVVGQVYNDAVTLGANTTLNAGAGVITFASTLDGAFSLAANSTGVTTFGGVVGGGVGTALTSLTTDAAGSTAINGGAVTTSAAGGQVYNDAVLLGANTILNAGAGAITFASTVGAAAGLWSLAANTTGVTTFGGIVGGGAGTALTTLTTNLGGATAINGGAVTTSGTQIYGDNVTLGAATTGLTGAGISFNGTVDGTSALTVTDSGTTTFTGAVGGVTALTSMVTIAGGTTAINGAVVNTTGLQTYGDAVTLGQTAVLTSTGSGAVSFNSTINSTVAGTSGLTVNTSGVTTFGDLAGVDTIGGTGPLAFLTTDLLGTVVLNAGTVTTTGAQTYNEAVTLGANTLLNTTNSNVTFGGTLNGTVANIQTLGITAGAGDVTFTGAVGGTTPLGAITIISARNVLESAGLTATSLTQTTGTGTTTLTGAVTTSGAAPAGISLTNTVIAATGALATTAGGNVMLNATAGNVSVGSIASSGALAMTATGAITEAVGSTITVVGLTTLTAAGNITLDSATNDFGVQAVNNGVTPNLAGTVTATGANITLRDANDMALNTIAGNTVTISAGQSILNANAPVANNITATIAAILSAGTGTVGTGLTTATAVGVNAPIVYAAAGGFNVNTSINLAGAIGDNSIHLLGAVQAMVILNGIILANQNVIGLNQQAFPSPAIVSANQLIGMNGSGATGGRDGQTFPATTAGSMMSTAYPTNDVSFQFANGNGVIGMLDSDIRISGFGMSLPMGVNGLSLNQFDEKRKI
ncbi:MAG: hypothetical protein Q7V63_02875 [Gammaproteobacteria bacterium]|nr:hypothetical protein [Gammaproteobacteria bacterium]